MYQLSEIKKVITQNLHLGGIYQLHVFHPDERKIRYQVRQQVLIGLYNHFALFEDTNGKRECFLYQDIFFQKEKEG